MARFASAFRPGATRLHFVHDVWLFFRFSSVRLEYTGSGLLERGYIRLLLIDGHIISA